MLRSGLVSITFRQLSPREVVELVSRAGLSGIEWGGDVHVPHGDTATAREVLRTTRDAGLQVAAYGSYYRIGHSEDDGLSFDNVLQTAAQLEAPIIRVWAGTKNSEDADEEYFQLIASETRRICERAERTGIQIATEFHGGTVCNTPSSTHRLMEAVNHPNLKTLWQPVTALSTQQNIESLREVLSWLANLHVFHWTSDGRHPLEEGEGAWHEYLSVARDKANWALLEFVHDDDPEQFLHDAATLKRWLKN